MGKRSKKLKDTIIDIAPIIVSVLSIVHAVSRFLGAKND